MLGHLKDADLISFLIRCKESISFNGGVIGIKENITRTGIDIDSEDSSMTRSDDCLKSIFDKAGLRIIREDTQKGFPKALYRVKMYLLQ